MYDAAALLARIGVGVVFVAHGWQKVQVGINGTADNFDAMGVPLPTAAAVYATFAELLGGVALILGLVLPLTGLALFLDMAGAIGFVHAKHGIFLVDNGVVKNGGELAIVLGLAALVFAAGGAGRITLDHHLFRARGNGYDDYGDEGQAFPLPPEHAPPSSENVPLPPGDTSRDVIVAGHPPDEEQPYT